MMKGQSHKVFRTRYCWEKKQERGGVLTAGFSMLWHSARCCSGLLRCLHCLSSAFKFAGSFTFRFWIFNVMGWNLNLRPWSPPLHPHWCCSLATLGPPVHFGPTHRPGQTLGSSTPCCGLPLCYLEFHYCWTNSVPNCCFVWILFRMMRLLNGLVTRT